MPKGTSAGRDFPKVRVPVNSVAPIVYRVGEGEVEDEEEEEGGGAGVRHA